MPQNFLMVTHRIRGTTALDQKGTHLWSNQMSTLQIPLLLGEDSQRTMQISRVPVGSRS
jgi:hypothetical protein